MPTLPMRFVLDLISMMHLTSRLIELPRYLKFLFPYANNETKINNVNNTVAAKIATSYSMNELLSLCRGYEWFLDEQTISEFALFI
jgi:hypothetical protein